MARGDDSRFNPRRLVGRGKVKLKEVDTSGEEPTPVPKSQQRGEAKGRTPQAQRTHDIVERSLADRQQEKFRDAETRKAVGKKKDDGGY
jgi:hypothetical protein